MAPCSICNDFNDTQRYIPISKLAEGIEQRCKGCGLIREAINVYTNPSQVNAIMWHVERTLRMRLLDEWQKELSIIELYTDQHQKSPWRSIGAARTVPVTAWDSSTAALARAWLDDCVERHTICWPPVTYKLPTRVIDVVPDPPRLYITQGECLPYVALSHCWGGEVAIITSTTTLQQHQQCIDLGDSAKTFSHAIQVTRDLGIRYLWIDSLCIVQDDEEDWAVEASKMAEVYKNATITISAEAARATSDGLFVTATKRENHQVTHRIERVVGALLDIPINARLRCPPLQGAPRQISHSSVEVAAAPLSRRAWTLQERLLPNRTLHFFEEELVWSCNSVSRCQCHIDASVPIASAFRKLEDKVKQEGDLEYDLLNEWPDIVMDFTSRSLTKSSDRLAALSGLATLYHDKTGEQYFAGLWEGDIAFQLLWMSDYTENTIETTAATIGNIRRYSEDGPVPTWSWASITGPVKYFQKHKSQFERKRLGPSLSPLLQVLGGSVAPEPLLPFGSVKKGVLVMVGQILPVMFNRERKLWRPLYRNNDEVFQPLVEPKAIFDIPSEHPSNNNDASGDNNDNTNEYFFLRAAIYIKGIMSTDSGENFCILLRKRDDIPGLSNAFNGMVFERRGVVLHGFGSKQVWSDELRAPKIKLCVV